MMDSNSYCLGCRYWKRTDNRGECRAHPPIPILQWKAVLDVSVTVAETAWPLTFADDWCGEFSRQGGIQ